jgi:hypothetical protein
METEERLDIATWFTRRNRNRQKHLWRRILDLSFADRQNANGGGNVRAVSLHSSVEISSPV